MTVPNTTRRETRSFRNRTDSGTPVNGDVVLNNAARAAPANGTDHTKSRLPTPVLIMRRQINRGSAARSQPRHADAESKGVERKCSNACGLGLYGETRDRPNQRAAQATNRAKEHRCG
jgi:hypothetical protein